MRKSVLALTAFAALASAVSHADSPSFPLLSGRNAVSFADAQYDSDYIGMGFVVEHRGRYYGVTAKHVLLVVNHPQIKQVDPGAQLSSWQMTAVEPQSALEFGALLNADPAEALDMAVLERDALVFALTDPGPFTPIKLSAKAPQAGEPLYALGCTFATQDRCSQDVYAGRMLEAAEHNLLLDMAEVDPASLRGLSGGPVVNADGELVGIVSNVLPDAGGTPRFAPAKLDYLREVLEGLEG